MPPNWAMLDDTRRALNNLNGEVSGRLTLATSHHIGLHRLPPLLREFTRPYPKVALDIQFLDSEVAYEEILHGRAELAVITLAPEPHSLIRAMPMPVAIRATIFGLRPTQLRFGWAIALIYGLRPRSETY